MKKALAIVDYYPTERGGHFHSWFEKIVRCAIPYVDFVGVYASGHHSMPLSITSELTFQELDSDVVFFDIEQLFLSLKTYSNTSKMNLIASHIANFSGCDNVAIFVMWSFDLLDSFEEPAIPWSGIGVLSALGRNIKTDSYHHENKLLDLVEKNTFCKNLLLWDSYIVDSKISSKSIFMPDIENIKPSEPLSHITKDAYQIGLVGQLWGYRGVDLLIQIITCNPNFSGLLSGVLKENSLSNEAHEYIKSEAKNLKINNKYHATDDEINFEISKLAALVIDGERYPCPSGIALRAMCLGRCIISSRGPSWINDVIKEYNCGLIVESSNFKNLHKLISEFYDNGGSFRASEAAKILMNEEKLSICIKNTIEKMFK